MLFLSLFVRLNAARSTLSPSHNKSSNIELWSRQKQRSISFRFQIRIKSSRQKHNWRNYMRTICYTSCKNWIEFGASFVFILRSFVCYCEHYVIGKLVFVRNSFFFYFFDVQNTNEAETKNSAPLQEFVQCRETIQGSFNARLESYRAIRRSMEVYSWQQQKNESSHKHKNFTSREKQKNWRQK